ncbi:MAG: MarR family winged helix-turn-helix transcriptional regulator [Pseudobdellovibrio sp.]
MAGHATMGDLIEQTFSDKASVTRTVSSLEKMGLVKRKTDDVDRRVSIIELTARGKLQAEKTHKIKSDIEDQLDTCLSVAETKQLCALTDKIIENLNKK